MFERHQPYPESADYIDSYYSATRNSSVQREALSQDTDTDICIVGAGFSGLSTALHLVERGYKVIILEGARVGWGASGRNGGQIVNGMNAGIDTIRTRFGDASANQIGQWLQEGAQIIRQRIAEFDIDCDLTDGNIFAAYTARHMRELERKHKLWSTLGNNALELLDKAQLRSHVGSDIYCGGLLDRSGGHIHPLNLALGEAAAVEKLGGRIFEHSAVTRVRFDTTQAEIHTQKAKIRCNTLILCGNAYLGNVVPNMAQRVMPVSTQIIATEPLPAKTVSDMLPTGHCVEDVRYILDYFRITADRRLLFGGGTVYGGSEPSDVIRKLRPAMLRVFPELEDVRIDYAWSGNFALSFTRMPQMGKLNDHTFFAHGYSGHGVTGSHLFGRILAEAIDGQPDRYDVFANLKWIPFPGGRKLRAPYSTLGSWWYAMRDRFGV